jgi:hypothetical protein
MSASHHLPPKAVQPLTAIFGLIYSPGDGDEIGVITVKLDKL